MDRRPREPRPPPRAAFRSCGGAGGSLWWDVESESGVPRAASESGVPVAPESGVPVKRPPGGVAGRSLWWERLSQSEESLVQFPSRGEAALAFSVAIPALRSSPILPPILDAEKCMVKRKVRHLPD